ncbi:glycosyltransferase involved in cell wall biosynthesis [Paenibacillus endophyticus]|uniref:Glycosyltransferase involved in cell wall biosynthesis n=1 Tax=Paenibacillus endophyticus TaxID=1294268 RepID=A0A7W5C905_9BACL|nr:glycosyltransferase family 4 protein [Paenibacillus endophyticus]MBB3153298.1 glycosyltransferase involved in cell wall biosynthesis [Paenibacillus endophyticus]
MNVLQIAVGVSGSKVYNKLFSEFKKQNLQFKVYVPLHQNKNIKDIDFKEFPFPYYSSRVIKPYDKVVYYTKICRMVKDVELNFNLSEVSLLHAHSLFSDGAVAYELYKKYNIPYIVAVRNTDVNKYFKYAFHLRKYALKIMRNAKKVIFISPSYQKYVLDKYVPNIAKKEIIFKTKVIPNGVDEFWLNETLVRRNINIKNPRLIFVGRIDKNKNLKSVLQVVQLLRNKGLESTLEVVGDGPLRDELQKECEIDNNIVFHGAIYDKEVLRDMYFNSDILVVPSFTETFGLVYLEAMSCGMPIIYTKNQGFDGFFEEGKVGYAVDPYNPKNMLNAINEIMDNYEDISAYCFEAVKAFEWENIAKDYLELYFN